MKSKLRIKSHFKIEPIIDENCVFLLSENENYILKGKIYLDLLPYLNGAHNSDEIVDKLSEHYSPAEIYYTLQILKSKGYTSESNSFPNFEEQAYWDSLNIRDQNIIEIFNSFSVSITSLIRVNINPLIQSLNFTGINNIYNSEENSKKNFRIIITDDYLRPEINEINLESISENFSWMLVKPTGAILWIGPIFIPGITGCYECLAQRLRAKRDIHFFIQSKKDYNQPIITSIGFLPTTLNFAYQLIASQTAFWAVKGKEAPLAGKIISINSAILQTQEHILTKRPQCPVCGKPGQLENLPIALKSYKKNFLSGTGHRISTPEKTYEKYAPHISYISGVVDLLIKAETFSNDCLHLYFAGHNSAMKLRNTNMLQRHLRSLSAGKGITDIQAKTGALCEAIERYSGLFQGNEPRIKSTYDELRNKAIFPNEYMNYSDRQFEQRKEINKTCHHFQVVPDPFNKKATVEFTPVWSLTNKEWKYILTSYCYYGYEDPNGYFFSWANSNGCASGNNIEEAILQGFFELVERDAVGIWWYNRIKRLKVNLESFNIPYIKQLHEVYKTKGRDFWVIDITTDLNIPVFVAVSARMDKKPQEIVFAFGCHFDPSVALLRAITEMNQFMPHFFSEAPEQYSFQDDFAINWWKNATLESEPYLLPDNSAIKNKSDYPQIYTDDFLTDINLCIEIMKEQRMEILVLDQTRPDIGLNVVKVIVPGLRHMWQRFGTGRLYSVPVKMGWLEKEKDETELNPIAIFV